MSLSHSNQRVHRSRRNLNTEVAPRRDQAAPYRPLEVERVALGDPRLPLEGAPTVPLQAIGGESVMSQLHSDSDLDMSPHISLPHSMAIDLRNVIRPHHHRGYQG